jgi:hypothetical protein
MHNIHMAEFTEEFAHCWNAAGSHIQRMAGGDLMSWLKATLAPPFLEHLSFRLGNQLFFIQIEDEDGMLEVPGSPDGLLAIANGCKGHPCLMPMKKLGGKWQPSAPGWGLIDAETRRSIDPISFVTDEKIEMTDWELQDFAVQVVRDDLKNAGRELMSWNGNPEVLPSIWFVGDHGPEWVIVRAYRFPEEDDGLPENIDEIKMQLRGAQGNYAAVGIADMKGMLDLEDFDSDESPIYRGNGLNVDYRGLVRID